MQTSGVPGRVHLAESTRFLLGDRCAFEVRKRIDLKGLGPMTTYLLADTDHSTA